MQIERLRLSGFKSFVEPAELRIEPGLTGIVGPNGCGKSNLLEALRWVMGENSAKSMRGGGMEDVIFAGTESRPAREFAEVMLTGESDARAFDPEAVHGARVDMEVVRRIARGAGSAYRLNGRDVRAKDISLLFADAATGAHSPALVSQGRVAAVIAAKPQARRQMLEEAAGISGLHVRRKDAETRLRAAESNLDKLAQMLADMDSRIGSLRRQARAAERYQELSAKVRQAEARLIYARWAEAKHAADTAREQAQAAEERLADAAARNEAARKDHDAAVRHAADARAEHGVLRDAMGQVEQQMLLERAALDRIETQVGALEAEAARLAGEDAREDRLTEEAASARRTLESDIATLAGDIEAAADALDPTRRTLERSEGALRKSEVAVAQAMAEEARSLAEARVARAAVEAAERRRDKIAADVARVEGQLAALGDPDALGRELEAARAERSAAEAEEAKAQAAIGDSAQTLERARHDTETTRVSLAALKADLSALESEHAALSRQLNSRSGENRIATRIKAAPGYETALAAALGDEAEAALGAPDGEGRFWRDAADDRDAPQPGTGIARLSDHVEAPRALATRLAFIWVADSDDGGALPPGVRLVTREGSLRRWDGYAGKGGAASLAEELRRKSRLDELDAALTIVRADADGATAALDKLVATQAAAEDARKSAEVRLRDISETLRAALRRADRLEDELSAVRTKRADLTERRDSLGGEQVEAEEDLRAAVEKLDALPDTAAQSAEVASLRKSGEDARQALHSAQADLSAREQALAGLREKRAVAQADLRGWTARAGEAANRAADRRRRQEEIGEELAVLKAKPDGHRARLTELEARKDSDRDELARRAEAEQAAAAALASSEAALADAAEAVASARESRAALAAKAESEEARRIEMGRVSGERFECSPPMLPERLGFDAEALGSPQDESAALEKHQMDRERIGPVNLLAAQELEQLEGEQTGSRAEAEEIEQAIRQLRGSIGSLNREGRARLLQAFEAVNGHFQRLFSGLFGGGAAHLELIDSDDPLEAGLEIMAQPPGKKLASLTLLSGGEQALTAVALIFGLFLTNPAPICVLDEVDAPLDDANIERFCDLLDRMVAETQTRYLIVTHNAVTMSRMHRLFGVTMVERGISRLVSVDLGGAEELLAAE